MAGRALEHITGIMRLLRHAPPERSHVVESRRVAKRLRDVIGMSCSGAYGSGGNRKIDEVVGKELAGGHEKIRKDTPPPKAR